MADLREECLAGADHPLRKDQLGMGASSILTVSEWHSETSLNVLERIWPVTGGVILELPDPSMEKQVNLGRPVDIGARQCCNGNEAEIGRPAQDRVTNAFQ